MLDKVIVILMLFTSSVYAQYTELGFATMTQFNGHLSTINANLTTSNTSFIAKMGEKARNQSKMIQTMAEIRGTIDDVNENIEDLYKLKQNVEKSYYTFTKFDELSYADFAYGFEQFTGVNVEPSKMLPKIPETQKLRNDLSRHDARNSSLIMLDRTYYGIHSRINAYRTAYKNAKSIEGYLQESNQEIDDLEEELRLAQLLENSYRDSVVVRNIQTATYYYTLADSLLAVSYEMQESIKKSDYLRLTDGDKANVLYESTTLQVQALELRREAQKLYDYSMSQLQYRYRNEISEEVKSIRAEKNFEEFLDGLYE